MSRATRLHAAKKAGMLADMVVRLKRLNQAERDIVVSVLRDCEKELINAPDDYLAESIASMDAATDEENSR